MTIQKDLRDVAKELQRLAKQTDNLVASLEKMEKLKAKPVKAKAKARVSAKKKPVRITDTGKVLSVVNRSKRGVDTATLIKKTGFDQKKIWSILQRAHDDGKIKRVGRGIYAGKK